MNFSQLLRDYSLNKSVEPLKCPYMSINIIDDTWKLQGGTSGVPAQAVRYYISYMDSLGDNPYKAKGVMSFACYEKFKAKDWERSVRNNLIITEKTRNAINLHIGIRDIDGTNAATFQPKDAQTDMSKVCRNWYNKKGTVLTLGSYVAGVGKTAFALSLCYDYFRDNDIRIKPKEEYPFSSNILFVTYIDLIRWEKENILRRIMDYLIGSDFLVIDDLFCMDDFSLGFPVYELLERRVFDLKKPTVITTLVSIKNMETNVNPIYSRLKSGTVYYTPNRKDYR